VKAREFIQALDALENLLPQHTLSCCLCTTEGWVMDSEGHPVITEESCNCSSLMKSHRKLLTKYRRSEKGFHPRYAATDPALP